MIVYNATKAKFNDDVNFNRISDIILSNLRKKKLPGGQLAEYSGRKLGLNTVGVPQKGGWRLQGFGFKLEMLIKLKAV